MSDCPITASLSFRLKIKDGAVVNKVYREKSDGLNSPSGFILTVSPNG